jgi:lysophospholipase L1-like esterase
VFGAYCLAGMGGRLRTWGLVVVFNAAGICVALGVSTEWFIARKRQTTLVYDVNPEYRQDLVPGQRQVRGSVEYSIGAHGLRGEPPAMPKPSSERRVVVLGGSSVFDFAVAPSWPERVEALLRAGGHADVRVVNAGVPGFSTREVLPFFERRIRPYSPDVAVLYAGWNDAKVMRASVDVLSLPTYPSKPPAHLDPYAFLRAPRPMRNLYALPIMFEKVRERLSVAGPSVAVVETFDGTLNDVPAMETKTPTTASAWADTPGVRYFAANVCAFIERARASGAVPVVVAEATLVTPTLPAAERRRVVYSYVGLEHDSLVALNDAMVRVARECATSKDALFIDPRPEVSGVSEYFLDHVHLSDAGSAALSKVVAEALGPVVR